MRETGSGYPDIDIEEKLDPLPVYEGAILLFMGGACKTPTVPLTRLTRSQVTGRLAVLARTPAGAFQRSAVRNRGIVLKTKSGTTFEIFRLAADLYGILGTEYRPGGQHLRRRLFRAVFPNLGRREIRCFSLGPLRIA